MSKKVISILLPLILAAGLISINQGQFASGSILSMVAILISSLWDYDIDIGINHVFATLLMLLASFFYENNLLYAIALFEVGMLFSIGFQGIKKSAFSLTPIFLLCIIFSSLVGGNTQFDLNVFYPILFILRTLYFTVWTSANSKNWSQIITFSLLLSSWWSLQISTSVLVFLSIVALEFGLNTLRLKRKNTILYNLLACAIALIFLKTEVYPILILLVMQAFTQRLQKDFNISKDELLIFCATILVILGTISSGRGPLETFSVLACIVLPLLGLNKTEVTETKITDTFGTRSILNMLLCVSGVVLFAFS